MCSRIPWGNARRFQEILHRDSKNKNTHRTRKCCGRVAATTRVGEEVGQGGAVFSALLVAQGLGRAVIRAETEVVRDVMASGRGKEAVGGERDEKKEKGNGHGHASEEGPSKKRRLLCSLGTGEVVHVMHFRYAARILPPADASTLPASLPCVCKDSLARKPHPPHPRQGGARKAAAV
jgi:hypothetical protein